MKNLINTIDQHRETEKISQQLTKSSRTFTKSKTRTRLFRYILLIFSWAILHANPVSAAILTVNCAAGPFFTINAAVAAAVNGDTIMIEECAVPYNENIAIAGFTGLHVVGVTPPSAVAAGDVGSKSAGATVAVNSLSVVSGAGLAGPCFSIEVSTDVKIQNLRLDNCTLGGVRVRSSRNVLVLANRIINSLEAAGTHAINTDNLQISSNLFVFMSMEAILLEDTRLSTLADNQIYRTGLAGIRLRDGANNRIDNNDVRLAGTQGLVVSGLEARIERNSFLQNGGAGPDILVENTSLDADIVGNSVPLGINDLGVGTELANNF